MRTTLEQQITMVCYRLEMIRGSAVLEGGENGLSHWRGDVEFLGSAREEEDDRDGVELGAAGIAEIGA